MKLFFMLLALFCSACLEDKSADIPVIKKIAAKNMDKALADLNVSKNPKMCVERQNLYGHWARKTCSVVMEHYILEVTCYDHGCIDVEYATQND